MALIKEIVSVSLGSSSRDHEVVVSVLGQEISMKRVGMDGDLTAMRDKLIECDENRNIDAIGIGGCDIFLNAAGRRYYFREIKKMVSCIANTPVVDGSGLKGAVEADTVRFMQEELGISFQGKNILVTSAIDRWGIAMACADADTRGVVSYGDLLYALDIPVMIHSKKVLTTATRILAPLAAQLPFKWLYPSESDSSTEIKRGAKTDKLYYDADIIVGDYKYVVQYMPDDMKETIVVTNTTTESDLELLHSCGVKTVVTTTPRLDGRSFGTNVMEAMLVALAESDKALTTEQYLAYLKQANFKPSVSTR
ncbi:MAG: quinate 5-dehydrogenase [Coriobacteriia bacterium]|nr:quinate 5-dehydrogenase [Coriobacteriia bacterium]